MAKPDALIRTSRLSRLPTDLLRIPLAKSVLTEDFVDYYEHNEARLSLSGTLQRIAYEHKLDWPERLLEAALDAPTELALWRDGGGRLKYFAVVMTRNVAAEAIGMVLPILPDAQLRSVGTLAGTKIPIASRLIPLSIVAPLLATDKSGGRSGQLWQTLYSQRLRLATLAGPKATFGWWRDAESPSLFFSAYAYYADWHATRALGIELPPEHWESLLAHDHYGAEHVLPRTLGLWFMQPIGLPMRTLLEGELKDNDDPEWKALNARLYAQAAERDLTTSPILGEQETVLSLAYARVLFAVMAKEAGMPPSARLNRQVADAAQILRESGHPSARALLLLAGKENTAAAPEILALANEETPTMDRALTLVWTQKVLGGAFAAAASSLKPLGDWQAGQKSLFGQNTWQWPASAALPKELKLNAAATGVTAVLRYDTAGNPASRAKPEKADSPGTIKRHLYRLEKQEEGGFSAVPLEPGETISTEALYLDEIHLLDIPREGLYGLLEVPLSPGATVETGTWGLVVDGEAMEKRRAEIQRDRYGVPVERMEKGGSTLRRHLLRFAQKGRFVLPPARYHAMYQPNQKAFENDGKTTTWTVK